MLTCFKLSWSKIVVFCYCTFAVDDIFAASFQIPESNFNTNTASEPGFNLNEEDMAKFHIWPTGTLPYYIDDFSFDKVLRDKIRMFLDGVNRLTVLQFVEIPRPPVEETTRWVLFINRKGLLDCADISFQNFTNEGVQRVVLGYHCLNSDENLADIVLSLVGVPAQHNSPNRDKHVVIQENNILRDKLYLFEKLKDDQWLFHNLMYDIDSAGHYGPYKYTKNGNITVQQRGDYYFHRVLGSQTSKPKEKGFSSIDILKIAMLYNYIVRKRETQVPECSKLFAPGSKLSGVRLKDTSHKIKPRNKPNQYLGKKKEVPDKEDYNEDENNDDHNLANDSKNHYYEDYGDNGNDAENNENVGNKQKPDENSILINIDSEDDINGNDYKNKEDDYIKKDDKNNENDNDKNDVFTEEDYYNEKNDSTDKKENKKKHNVNSQPSNDIDDEDNTINNEEKNDNNDSNIENQENHNQNSESYEYVTKSYTTINTTSKNLRPLAHKIDHLKKQKLLGQSDYETGDEGNKKYIHEKNI